jgi:hypothetical protein
MGHMKDKDLELAEKILSLIQEFHNAWEFGEITGGEMYQKMVEFIAKNPIE